MLEIFVLYALYQAATERRLGAAFWALAGLLLVGLAVFIWRYV